MPLPRPAAVTAPGPSGARMLRAARRIRRDPLGFLVESRARYGEVVQFPIPSPPTYLVSEPAAVRRVLVTNAAAYGKQTLQYRALATVTGEGLLAADTATWKLRRPIVQPAFHRGAIPRFTSHAAAAAQHLQRRWDRLARSGEAVDVEGEMADLALDVVGRSLLGTDLTAAARTLADATADALDVVLRRASSLPVPAWVPTPGRRRLTRAMTLLDAAAAQVLTQRRARPVGPAQDPDLLDLLLGCAHLDDRQVRDEVLTFVVAGHETVASALTWAWVLLARNPDVLARLRAEADQALSGDAATDPDLGRLPYTRAVIDEVLRIYPPVWLITRRSLAPDRLDDVAVPQGALLILSPWLVHRDPARWDRPEQFRPERFLSERGAAARALAYLPFGAGPRQCIGREVALVEAVVALAVLASRYDVRPLAAGPPRPVARVTVRPEGGLPALVQLRR